MSSTALDCHFIFYRWHDKICTAIIYPCDKNIMLLSEYGTVKTTVLKKCEYCPRANTPYMPSLQIPFGYQLFYICLRIIMASKKIGHFSLLFKPLSTISYSFHTQTNTLTPLFTVLLSCLYMKQLASFIHPFYKDRLHWLHNFYRLYLCCGHWCPTLSLRLFLPSYILPLYICPLCVFLAWKYHSASSIFHV